LLARAAVSDKPIFLLSGSKRAGAGSAACRVLPPIEEVRRDMGCAVLMVSHDLHVVDGGLSDRVFVPERAVLLRRAARISSPIAPDTAHVGHCTKGALATLSHEHSHFCYDHTPSTITS